MKLRNALIIATYFLSSTIIFAADVNLYYGQLHSHTSFSDGQGSVDEAYIYAREEAGVDFLAITDHSNQLDNDFAVSISDGTASTEWQTGLATANKYNEAGHFAAIYAFEMTWSASTGKWGHMNTYNTPGFESRNNKEMDLKNYYATLATIPGSVSQMNHPGNAFGDFANFGYYSKEADKVVTLIEVANGEGDVRGSGYYPSYEYYTKALDMGWHLAPTNGQDNHAGEWGNANTARTVVEAVELTRESVYDALRNMRVYATEDENLAISYKLNGHTMGSILENQDALDFAVIVYDPDETDELKKVELITDGGKVAAAATEGIWKFSLDPTIDSTYFYLRATQTDGDIAVTAPIWIGDKENLGISAIKSSSQKAIVGDDVEVEVVLYNNESYAMEDALVKYWVDGEVVTTAIVGDVAKSDMANSVATISIDDVGANMITVSMEATINGEFRVFMKDLTVTGVEAEDVTRVLIDGSKNNAYVTGGYIDNMHFTTELIQENGGVAKINKKTITDDVLAGIDLLIITDAQSKDPGYSYSESELAAIKKYTDGGGNLIITSKADYGDAAGEFGNAAQGNAILEAIGATARFNDDQMIDQTRNGGQVYRLYLDDYNAKSEYTDGVKQSKFSFYSGNTVLANEAATIVRAHATSESSDADMQNDSVAVGDTVALAIETLVSGAKVAVSGVTFFSDFEMDPSNEYSNPVIMANILRDFAPAK